MRVLRAGGTDGELVIEIDGSFVGFRGHFPGAPVMPGFCHVDLARRAAGRLVGRPLEIASVERARFPAPLAPGVDMQVSVAWNPRDDGTLSVTARHEVAGQVVADLVMRLRDA